MSTTGGERIDVPALITKYENQILNGCGNKHCVETLCHTGQLNTQKLPARKPTARTARTIAITMCSSSKPEQHLCRFYDSTQGRPSVERSGKDYDYSSLAQLLSEKLMTGRSEAPAYPLAFELQALHRQLDSLDTQAYPSSFEQDVLSNTQLADALMPYLDWLIGKLPLRRLAVWEMVDRDIVSRGRTYPQKLENRPNDDQYNTWLNVLDVLDNEMYLRLLQRVVTVVARRMALQRLVSAVKSDSSQNYTTTVQYQVASKWCQNGQIEAFALVVWLKRLFAKQWRSDAIVEEDSIEHAILELFHKLGFLGSLSRNMQWLPVIRSRTSELDLANTLLSHTKGVPLLHYPMLFQDSQLFVFFRASCHLTMREAHSDSLKAETLRQKQHTGLGLNLDSIPTQARHSEEHYLLLSVSRIEILKDTFDQLWQRRKTELRLPLRVRLGQADDFEVGHDLGGVQIEFFNVVCREALAQSSQMFDTDPTTGISYFRPCSLQPLHMFELLGMVVALAMYNGVTLPIRLPPFFYWLMNASGDAFNWQISVEWIYEVWPAIGSSLLTILDEDIEGLDFAFPLEANGLRLSAVFPQHLPTELGSDVQRVEMEVSSVTPIQHHQETGHHPRTTAPRSPVDITDIQDAWPGWNLVRSEVEPIEVTPENKSEYVESYIKWLAYGSVAPQFRAFMKGFRSSGLVPNQALEMFNHSELKSLIEGTEVLNINELRAVAGYDGYEKTSKYIQNFWRIVTGWSQEKQKLLLKFVTAAERIPITGASSMIFIIKKVNVDNIEDLPMSSTCFGTLMLPRYPSSEILAQKLELALKYGTEGFGTG